MKVILEAIQFNHQANSATNDAFNIRRNESDPLIGPEWQRGISVGPEDSPAAYARQETLGRALVIKARFSNPSKPNRASSRIKVKVLNGNGTAPGDPINVLGESSATDVTLINGSSGLVDFTFNNPSISQVGVTDITLRWVYSVQQIPTSWTEFAVTHHRIYTVLSLPKLPWMPESANASNTQLPWTEVLEHACRWASGATDSRDALERITRAVNQSGFLQYDVPSFGSQHFTFEEPTPTFDCTGFLDLLEGRSDNLAGLVNCDDCAAIVSSFANILGCDVPQSSMFAPSNPDFPLKRHLKIGIPGFQRGRFIYHTVAWDGTEQGEVSDACLQLDGSVRGRGNPVPLLAANMPFVGTTGYRFRLVAAGHEAECEPIPATMRRRIGL